MSYLICSQAKHYAKVYVYHEWCRNHISRMLKVKAENALSSKERDDNFGRISCSIKSISLISHY